LNFDEFILISRHSIQYHNRIVFTQIWRHNAFKISVHPPSWICDDVMILYPLIDFHGPNIVLNCYVDWFGSFHTNITNALLTTDRQTHGEISASLKAPSRFQLCGAGLETEMRGKISRSTAVSPSILPTRQM